MDDCDGSPMVPTCQSIKWSESPVPHQASWFEVASCVQMTNTHRARYRQYNFRLVRYTSCFIRAITLALSGSLFQQDDARSHVRRKTVNNLSGTDIHLWPLVSPYLFPIEHVWVFIGWVGYLASKPSGYDPKLVAGVSGSSPGSTEEPPCGGPTHVKTAEAKCPCIRVVVRRRDACSDVVLITCDRDFKITWTDAIRPRVAFCATQFHILENSYI
ncbi:hypothetical protein TNCV_4117721 [Trichonephila clavipes]|nr:hypothetical protein TNCV_4117721 [Trichonephila clavipes]